MARGSALPALLPQSSGTRVFYVDAATGADSNAGTSEGAPWATLQDFFSGTAGPSNNITPAAGDLLLVKDYPSQVASGASSVGYRPPSAPDHVISAKSGTALDPVTVKAYPGHRPIILGPTGATPGGIVARPLRFTSTTSYWRFQGFELPYGVSNGANDPLIYAAGTSNHIEIRDCLLHGSTDGSGTFIDTSCAFIHFVNCEFWANNDWRYTDGDAVTADTVSGNATISNITGVTSPNSGNILSSSQSVQSAVTGPGIPANTTILSVSGATPGTQSAVLSNPATANATGASLLIFDMQEQSHGGYVGGADDCLFLGCIFRDHTNGYGSQVRLGGKRNVFAHCVFAYNVMASTSTDGAGVVLEGDASGTNDNKVVNCIVASNEHGIRSLSATTYTGNRAWRNVAFSNPLSNFSNSNTAFGWDWSLDGSGNYASPPGGNVVGDPKFVDAAARNFRVQADSAAAAFADETYTPDIDRDGAAIVVPNAGAYSLVRQRRALCGVGG